MTDPVAKKMSEASSDLRTRAPKKGEKFRCAQCGMELEVTSDCKCDQGAHFHCCGKELSKV